MKGLVFQVWKSCFQPVANRYLVNRSPTGIFDVTTALVDTENVDFDVLYAILLTFCIALLCLLCWWPPSWKMEPCVNRTYFWRCHHAVSWPPHPNDWFLSCTQMLVLVSPPSFGPSAAALGYSVFRSCHRSWKMVIHQKSVFHSVHGITFLPARRYASASNSDRNVSVCPSVRPSDTRRYCVKTKKVSGMISSPSGSPKSLVFWRQISSPNSKGFPPNGGLKRLIDWAGFNVSTNTV